MTMCWMLCFGTATPALAPAVSNVTSSRARTRNPAGSINVRISSGGRRKFDAPSRAHITGKTTGWAGLAIGSWMAGRPPGPSTRANPA
jgi:hypothetical protein